MNEKVEGFIKAIELEVSKENSFAFEKEKSYFIQDLTYNRYDESLPYFVLPISSATKQNIEPLKFALYDLISRDKCVE